MLVDFAGQLQILVLYIFSKSQQNSGAELVIQETALDVARLSDTGTGIHADEGTVFDPKRFYVLFGRYLFIQQDFHGVKSSLGLLIIVVDMDGSVGQLYGTVVYFTVQRVDTAVFSLDVVRVQAADPGQAETTVALDLSDHAAQRIYMGHGQNGVAFAADLYENTALFGLDRLVAEAFVFLAEIIRYFFRETGRTVDSQQGFRLF